MNQRKQSKKSKRMPVYSADAMAVHLVSGLLLIALGVLIFLAVGIRMSGDVFTGLRNVCFGLAGSMAVLLSVFPIWGGVLVVLSTQRKAPVRPFLLAAVLCLLLLACANLLTFTGVPSRSLMDYYAVSGSGRGFDLFLAKGYTTGAERQIGGGLLGMILAWPLWSFVGPVPAAVVYILTMILVFLVLIRFDAKGTWAKLRARSADRRAQEDHRQEDLRRQELQWQQQQQMQAQQRAQQQQAWQQQAYGAQAYTNQNPPPTYDYNAPLTPPPQQNSAGQMPIGFQPTEEELHGVKGQSILSRLLHREQTAQPTPVKPARRTGKGIYDKPDEQSGRSSARTRRSGNSAQPQYTTPQQPVPQYTTPQQPVPQYTTPQQPVPQYTTPQQPVPQYTTPQQPVPQYTTPQQPVPQYTTPQQPVPQYTTPQEAVPAQTDWQRQINERMAASGTISAQPDTEERPHARTRRTRNQDWDDSNSSSSRSSWRKDDNKASGSKPGVQQPKGSWTDDDTLPPWDDDIAAPAAAVVPAMQQGTPASTWKPELDLAPTKDGEKTLGGFMDEEVPEIPYVYPGLELLSLPKEQSGISAEEDAIRAQRLEDTLASFKVTAKVRHVTHGPAISRFELELAAGIKVNKVTDLAQNIAMNMEVKSVRIEAPIPGKSLVGVEVPNRKTATVTLREIMESEPMRNAKSKLTVALGKDIAGTPIVCDLARMPHLLIAGATGSGKSVCINTMINSLLYRCSPKEVRLILVDPKVVELQGYNGVPHLLIPVVSDPHKAAGALAWAVAEMMDRYKKFQIRGVRAIDGYNASLEEGEERMPRIVIIIDELADLMMTCKRDVEDHICRLAQLARAAGIHLVVATQRPSVDVITGLIKANIPSRIAFKVSSFIDSRTILDKMGAEQLLGWGDMLYQPTGEFTPIRIQGCFMSDDEVNGITDFIRSTCPNHQYDPNVLEELDRLTSDDEGGMPDMTMVDDVAVGGDGSLLAQCIEMAVNDGQVSTSLIQRRLKVGYARAGRLVDEMEKRGIVSQKDGAKPRMCLLSREEYERMKESGELDA